MANKKKTEDLKVTSDELQDLQSLVTAVNRLRMQIGELEINKSMAIERFNQFRKDLSELEAKLKNKYGEVSVNVEDGTLKEIPTDETNKKN
jgi:predicted nuclease with TOPRIM domain|tara:strand:+ start:399 stop:671 length:273 start_codon:yes stop_codon:yes gene_type:complete